MSRFLFSRATLGAVAFMAFPALQAGQNERIVQSIPAAEKKRLERLESLSPAALDSLAHAVSAGALEQRTREILSAGSLAIGSRPSDTPGDAPIHRYLRNLISRLAPDGVEILGAIEGSAMVPVALANSRNPVRGGESSVLEVGGQRHPVSPLWPNGMMPSLVPKGGLHGPLVDAGNGEWEDIAGLDLNGSIAIMNFQGGRNFERLFSLGAQAVVVVGDDHVVRDNATHLFCNTPVPMARFYVDRANGEALRRQATRREYDGGGNAGFVPGEQAGLFGGNLYERRPYRSLFAYLPPTPPLRVRITERMLTDLIGADFGVTADQIGAMNSLPPIPGAALKIPGVGTPYTVKTGDLLGRLALAAGVGADAILLANKLTSPELAPGQEITIPNLPDTLTVLVPIDSVSVVPEAPHGAFVAGNIAASTSLLEHLATAPGLIRRKGILFGFLDAENLGGLTSRKLAESLLIRDGTLGGRAAGNDPVRIQHYQTISRWLSSPSAMHLPDDAAHWFAEKWLASQIEKYRVRAAEDKARAVNELETHPNDPELLAKIDASQSRIDAIKRLRNETLGDASQSWSERVAAFFQHELLTGNAMPFTAADFRSQLDAELTEELEAGSADENNRKVTAAVSAKLGLEPGKTSASLGFYLDLSGGSATIGLKTRPKTNFRGSIPAGSDYTANLGAQFRRISAWAAVRSQWKDDFAFVADGDASEFAVLPYEAVPFYPEFWQAARVGLLPLGSLNDSLPMLDTPRDEADNVNFENLAVQARTAGLLIQTGLESPLDSTAPASLAKVGYGRLTGRTLQFNIRSGIDAQEPVPGALVYYPALAKQAPASPWNTLAARGSRRGIVETTLLNGQYTLPIEEVNFNLVGSRPGVFAQTLDLRTALPDRVVDQGQVGTKKQTPEFKLVEGRASEKNLVMTAVTPLVFFAGSDPMDYQTIGEAGQSLRVTDVLRNGEPEHFALVNPSIDYYEQDVASTTLFMTAGRRARIVAEKNGLIRMMLPGPANDQNPKGAGLLVGPIPPDNRNLALVLTPLHVARGMQVLAERRQALYKRFGIHDQAVADAFARSGAKLAEAEKAASAKQWQNAVGAAREAWGIAGKFYPRILKLGRDAVFSVIILMALLVPACVFLEKLIIGSRTVIGHLLGASGIFVTGVVFLRFFHPAFRVSVSPFIVVIAFVMILMSLIVLVISYGRFEVLLHRARNAGGEAEAESITLASSLATALRLGVSNLKKRPSRTLLTTLTVTILTFSIVAFVSVHGTDSLSVRWVAQDADVEGRTVVPVPPNYSGVLFREFYWQPLTQNTISALGTEFGSKFEITTRGWFVQVEGGSGADREGANQFSLRHGAAKAIITGVMSFEPNEPQFSGLNRAVTGGEWFHPADPANGTKADRFKVILPDKVAASLGITAAMLRGADGKLLPADLLPRVSMLDHEWKVIGILDTAEADRIRDINGKSLAMVDYVRSGFRSSVAGELASEPVSYHMGWERLAIVPAAAAADVQATPRSVAVRLPESADNAAFFGDLVLRLNRTFFSSRNGGSALITTKKETSLGGVAKIVVPVILCILIVTNTMMGTVDERKSEVGMLGAIGLSPSQIAFLLLSESAVFSVLGIVFGVFGGLSFANLTPWIAAHFNGLLGSLSFNFTSIASMGLAIGTGLVVLLATLLPARKAAALAAPSGMAKWKLPPPSPDGLIRFELPFTLTRGNALGMLAFFRRFLLNHSEPTSADFNCRNVRADIGDSLPPSLRLAADMWLSPYDLDVAQHFTVDLVPAGDAGVFSVHLLLQRTSGTEEAWLRTNYGFLDLVRRQFLLWRQLAPEARAANIASGGELLRKQTAAY